MFDKIVFKLSLALCPCVVFAGVLANEANITLIDFPEGFYFDWPQPNVTISHRAATSWRRQQLQNEWNKMVHNGIEIMKKNYMPP